MATMHTPPIDQYDVDDAPDEAVPTREFDDREIGFALAAFPSANGDLDTEAVSKGDDRWGSVLGW